MVAAMRAYIGLVRFTDQGLRNVRATHAHATQLIAAPPPGIRVGEVLWTSGQCEMVLIVEAPDDAAAMAAAFRLESGGNVRVEVSRAFTAAEIGAIIVRLPAASP